MGYLKKAMSSPIYLNDCKCSPWMLPFKIFNTLKVRSFNFDVLTFSIYIYSWNRWVVIYEFKNRLGRVGAGTNC